MEKFIFPILLACLFNIPLAEVTPAHQKQPNYQISQQPTPEDIENQNSEATIRPQTAWKSGRYNQAYQIIQTITDTSAKSQLLRDLAKAYLAVGQKKTAANLILQSVELSPKDESSDLYYWIGELFATGQEAQGKALLNTIANNDYLLAFAHQSIAEAYVKVGQYNAAFEYARFIPPGILLPLPEYTDPKVELLNDIIDKSLKAGQTKLALQVATSLDGKDYRVYALQTIAEHYKNNGNKKQAILMLDIALSIAKTIESISVVPERSLFWSEPNDSILVNLAHRYIELGDKAKGLQILSLAIESVQKFENQYAFDIPVWHKSKGLIQISNSYIKLGEKDKAKELIAQSLIEAETIQGDYYKIQELIGIAQKYTEIGEWDTSVEILEKTLPLIETVGREYDKISFLMTIHKNLLEIDEKEKAGQVFQQAISLIETTESESEKISYLIPILSTYISTNENQLASQLARRILGMIQRLDNPDNRKQRLDELVVNSLNKDNPKLALQIIQSIPAKEDRARILFAIATRYANMGNSALSSQFLSQALATLDEISNKEEQNLILEQTARNIASLYYDYYQNTLGETWRYKLATQIVNTISNPPVKADMLLNIAIQYSRLGEDKISASILETALAISKDIQPQIEWQTRFFDLIDAGIAAEEYHLALKLLQEVDDLIYHTVILRQIAQQYQIEGNKEEAEKFLAQAIEVANRIDDDRDRNEAWVGIREQQEGW
ncbi:MAG TPA: hypothetical protein DEG17_25390 [Cyanobacteria bacterium UBA11149]|nr:hypothetical protein [Cyanobacteria bacterium UBA11367]HBE58818.1 hypothetical protein [Cyanobacteria bacterium UBA11366]HBK64405.1 hypothetical protein [Cyanobacteria bacterium UBA11166]HBR73404.1 hypothetical protein [Cyanobacteria bacterium UBA11159]HBS68127.1 hypothetical protein [Cyanobacteria bacterium UBA11153]HBW92111.1 hypothetical protein [Cyanobacteria bacterium UBA11149]HCA97344.1 hypothetical protein [Cyanobacteria bacterium UBA9226]